MTERHRLPNRRASRFFDFTSMNMKFTASFSRDADGIVREFFIDNHKAGSGIGTLVRDSAALLSFALQHSADIDSIRRALARDSTGQALGPVGVALDEILKNEAAE
jgi:hypothetical protein